MLTVLGLLGVFLAGLIFGLPEWRARVWEGRWAAFVEKWEARFARTKLGLCEPLQAMVLSEQGRRVDRVDGERVQQFYDHYRGIDRKSLDDPAADFAVNYCSFYEQMELQEEMRIETIRALEG